MITIMIVPQRKVLRRKEVEEGEAFLENQETLDPTGPKMRIVETFRNLVSEKGLWRALVTRKTESSIRAWKLKSFVCVRQGITTVVQAHLRVCRHSGATSELPSLRSSRPKWGLFLFGFRLMFSAPFGIAIRYPANFSCQLQLETTSIGKLED